MMNGGCKKSRGSQAWSTAQIQSLYPAQVREFKSRTPAHFCPTTSGVNSCDKNLNNKGFYIIL